MISEVLSELKARDEISQDKIRAMTNSDSTIRSLITQIFIIIVG